MFLRLAGCLTELCEDFFSGIFIRVPYQNPYLSHLSNIDRIGAYFCGTEYDRDISAFEYVFYHLCLELFKGYQKRDPCFGHDFRIKQDGAYVKRRPSLEKQE